MGNLNYCKQKEDEKTQIRSYNPCDFINFEDNNFLFCDYSENIYDTLTFSRNHKKEKKTETKYNIYTEKKVNKNKYDINNKSKFSKNKLLQKSLDDIRNKSLPHLYINKLSLVNEISIYSINNSNIRYNSVSSKNIHNKTQILKQKKPNKSNNKINNIHSQKYPKKNNTYNNKKIKKSNTNTKINNNCTKIKSAIKIQKKFRSIKNKMYFQKYIRPKLIKESEHYINSILNRYKKNIIFEPEEKYSLFGYQKFYPKNDKFFKFNYGKVFNNQIRIEKISEEEFSIYQGEMNINNQRHGFGKLITPKYTLIGTWRNNNFTGWCRESNNNGNYIEGKFINGVINGKGILGNKKNKYIGDFVNSIRNGKGELITNKFHYKGDFVNNELEGYGKMKFLIEGHEYEGNFKGNQIEGRGIFIWKNGDKYIGEMKNGKLNGKGIYYYSNGDIFEGSFVNGIKQAGGKMKYHNRGY